MPTPTPTPPGFEQAVTEFLTFVASAVAPDSFKAIIGALGLLVIVITRASGAVRAIVALTQKLQHSSHVTPATPAPANGGANGNGNGNGNGHNHNAIQLLTQGLRVEADAREADRLSVDSQFREINTRWRRDSDAFYMLFSELKEDGDGTKAIVSNIDDRVVRLEAVVFVQFPQITTSLAEILKRLPPPDEMEKAS